MIYLVHVHRYALKKFIRYLDESMKQDKEETSLFSLHSIEMNKVNLIR